MQGAVFWVPLIMPENTDNRKNKASTGINCPGSFFCALFGLLRPGEGVFFSPTSAKRTHTYTKTSYMPAGYTCNNKGEIGTQRAEKSRAAETKRRTIG